MLRCALMAGLVVLLNDRAVDAQSPPTAGQLPGASIKSIGFADTGQARVLSGFLSPAITNVEWRIRPAMYDEKADGAKQIGDALVLAKKEDKHVLLQFGANWCSWCVKLHKLFQNDKPIVQTLRANYVVVLIDVNEGHNRGLVRKYEAEYGFGLPFIVILDAGGKRLITQNTAVLEEGDHHSPQKVLHFLRGWSPGAIRNKPASEWVEEFVAMPEQAFNSSSLEFQRIQELGAAAVPALIDVIRVQSPAGVRERETLRRTRACWALGALGPSARSAVPFLAEEFRTSNDLRQFIGQALAKLGSEAKDAVPVLIEAFNSTDPQLQADAGGALVHVAPSYPRLVPELTRWLSSSNVFCRRVAPRLLAELGPAARAALPALRKASNDDDQTVSKNAVKALEQIGRGPDPKGGNPTNTLFSPLSRLTSHEKD